VTRSIDKRDVASTLHQIASFMEFRGDGHYRTQAFNNAARAIASLNEPIEQALADGSLERTRGIGSGTLKVIRELMDTGHSSLLEDLREQVPPGLVEMMSIGGLGVAKIKRIHDELGVDNISDLEAAARDGRLAALPRFGSRTADNILRGIGYLRKSSSLRLLHHALEEAETLRESLCRVPGVVAAHIAGEARRRLEAVRTITVVVSAKIPSAELFERLAEVPGVQEFSGQDERMVVLKFSGGATAEIIVTPPANLGAVLVEATGSAAHLQDLADRASKMGYRLKGAALWRGSTFVATPDEDTFYRELGLPWIPPELREGVGEVAAAEADGLPNLIVERDLLGILHCHTSSSDGTSGIAELAQAAQHLGKKYLGITDHSESAAYAGGLRPDHLTAQAREIDRLNQRLSDMKVLKGIEADILPDGSIDYSDQVLAGLDFVIASVHSRFHMSRDQMTHRILAAMKNPYVNIIGHPTGRILQGRRGYEVDLEAIAAEAASQGIALEINADPHRMDLDWRMVRTASAAGAAISIGADAHNVAGLANAGLGLAMARKGWLEAGQVVNTMDVADFLGWAQARRPE